MATQELLVSLPEELVEWDVTIEDGLTSAAVEAP
jgi:hypothetical protein